jgi:N-acetyl-gamma-glutamyl-phosphate reductase
MTRAATLAQKESQPIANAARRVAVLGSTGYAGQEFLRLARGHAQLQITALGVRDEDAQPPRGAGTAAACSLRDLEVLVAAGACDTLVSCLPHGIWHDLVRRHPALAVAPQIVDLSSDHRDGAEGYVYGLPEAFRSQIARAQRLANPGCYATAASLALLPAAESGWIAGPVAVSALSGVSGAGRALQARTAFVEAEGGAWAYRVGTEHAHVAEVERTLSVVAHCAPTIGFVPQVVPMTRGILLTAFAPLRQPLAPEQARERYQARYAGEPYVRLLAPGEWPETRATRQSNRCDLAVTTLHGGGTLLVVAALDNLVKGAAGQAIQNLNLMNGWPETTGLPLESTPW